MRMIPLLATGSVALLSFGSGLPTAQSAESAGGAAALEEITVTARKIEENIMTIPVSVTALSAKDIENLGLKDMQDVSLFQPSFHFVNQVGGQSGFADRSSFLVTFRGLVEGPGGTFATGSGSVFIDGAPVIDAQVPSLDEIQRVEVLKGPQSAYFGRSTFAGAINYVTKDPSLTKFGGSATGESSSYGSNDESLSLDIPLINDELGVRVSARHLFKGGEYTNAADPSQKFGDQETESFSGTILFVPSDKLKVKGFVNWFTNNDGPPAELDVKNSDGIFNCKTGKTANYTGGYFCGSIPNVGQLPTSIISGDYTITPFLQQQLIGNAQNYPLTFNPNFLDHAGLRRNALQGDIKIDWEILPGYDLSSLTAYHYDKSMEIVDLDFRDEHNKPNFYYHNPLFGYPFVNVFPLALPYEAFNLGVQRLVWDTSEEIRLTSPRDRKLKWSVGASYLHNYAPSFSLYGQWDLGVTDLGNITPTTADTPAIFGSVSYEIIDKLTLTFEAREQWDKIREQNTYAGGKPTAGAAATILESTYQSFSPRLSLDYAYAPDSTVYALWSRGYRPGGFNSYVLTAKPADLAYLTSLGANTSLTYAQERLDNFEVGLKSTFLDGKARTTLTLYYDKWNSGQIATVYNVPGSNQYSPINNTGLIDLYGLEFEGDWQALQHLVLQLTAAYNGTRVVSYAPCTDCLNFQGKTAGTGDHVPNAPEVTATISAEYSDHLTGDWNWYGRADFAYQGSQYLDYTNTAWTQPQEIVNLHLGLRSERLTLEAFVRNLGNNSAPNSTTSQVDPVSFFSPPSTADVRYALPDKRTVGVKATLKF